MEKEYRNDGDKLKDLANNLGRAAPDAMSALNASHKGAVSEGAEDVKRKELVALTIAETVGVAVPVGDGPSSVYGYRALEAMQQFEAE